MTKMTLLFAFTILALPFQAFGYIDPGAGSMLVQLLMGGLAGFFLVFRIFGKNVVKALKFGRFKSIPQNPSELTQEDLAQRDVLISSKKIAGVDQNGA